MKKVALIVAGGSGSRMQSDVPKQFMLLKGVPLLMHSIRRFKEADASTEIVVVIPEKQFSEWQRLCKQFSFSFPHNIADEGETRFHSVKNGLKLVAANSVVAVHDGARPLVSVGLINRCFEMAHEKGNAVPVVPVKESIRKVDAENSISMNRDSFVLVQTPQCFHSEQLLQAYLQPYDSSFTDDASVVEKSGKKIHLIDGEPSNIKVTYPSDFLLAESLMKQHYS